MPAGMYEPQGFVLQDNWQGLKKIDVGIDSTRIDALRDELTGRLKMIWLDEPAVSRQYAAKENIEFMIAHQAIGMPPVDQMHDFVYDGWAVRSTIDEVAEENQVSPFTMGTMLVVTQVLEQRFHYLEFPVHIADDVNRAVGQIRHK